MEHDDHTCYYCKQRMLNPAREPTTPWRAPLIRACDQLCHQCSRQECCLRYLHDVRACYWCNLHPGCVPTPGGREDTDPDPAMAAATDGKGTSRMTGTEATDGKCAT